MKIVFFYLKAFSITGGIEKFNKAFMKALGELGIESNFSFEAVSVYDSEHDEKYIHSGHFKGFGGNKLQFILHCLLKSLHADIIIFGHINLAPLVFLINKIKPHAAKVLIAHGIEVWHKCSILKKSALYSSNTILSVSSFTMEKLIKIQGIPSEKIYLFPDTLDPYFNIPYGVHTKPAHLVNRLGISSDSKVLLTVSRVSSSEQYKGYDKVIQSLPVIMREFPNLKYIIVGRGDENELRRLDALIEEMNLKEHIILTGYVEEGDLNDYYLLSDVFVMPSKREGFGIVFLEALACGRPVIAGNQDGSRGALLDGELGILVDPDNVSEISKMVIKLLRKEAPGHLFDPEYLRDRVIDTFGFNRFKERLREVLEVVTA